jgi:hypothetical protein
MSTSRTADVCEASGVNATRHSGPACLIALLLAAAGFSAAAQSTNNPAATNAPAKAAPAPVAVSLPGSSFPLMRHPATNSSPAALAAPRVEASASQLDESAFRIVSERNVFNANRSGGQVRLSTRRTSRVESFALVGTLAYEKGAFAFFDGSSSEFTKVLKPNGVIAGHKLVDILTDGVKLEADGKTFELAIGSAMRREDEGAWHPGEGVTGGNGASSGRDGDDSSRSRRGDSGANGSDPRMRSAPTDSSSSADQA